MKLPSTTMLALAALLSGCGGAQSSSAAPAQDDSACREIGQACHDADSGEGEAHECHVSAHATWSPAQCAEHRDHCVSVCARHEEGSSHHEAGGAEPSDEHASDPSG